MHPDFSALEELVPRRLKELEGASISIGVSMNGETLYERSFGFADKESKRPATPDTPYSVASVSKPVLGTGLAIMLQEGLIDLYAPLNRYLKGAKLRALEGDAEGATIARLANHTAGLPTHYQFFSDQPVASGEVTLSHYGTLTRPPGEANVYANLGFGFLGTAIERVAGISLQEFLETKVFVPLGMPNSFLLIKPIDPLGAALRYDEKGQRLPPYVTDHPGASDVHMSVRDVMRFGEAHLGHRPCPILSRESILRMQEPTGSAPCEQQFGITWARRKTASGESVVAHSGGMAGVSTRLILIPSRGLVITVLCNFESSLDDEVFEVLYKAAGVEFAPQPERAPAKPFPTEAAGSWQGTIQTYAGDKPIRLTVTGDGTVCVDGSDSDAKFEDGQITGSADGCIATPDALRLEHKMALDLQFRGDRLTGSISALTVDSARIRNRIAYAASFIRA